MISLDSKTQNASENSPLSLSPKSDTPSSQSSLFSQLLSDVTEKKDGNIVQNGALVLALDAQITEIKDESKTKASSKEIVSSLLQKSELKDDKRLPQPLELNPQITKALSPTELKELVSDAKKYLKTKIIESEGFKKSEIEALPKTLKGLVAVAKKFHLDVSKITYEEIKESPKSLKPLKLQTAEAVSLVKQELKTDISERVTPKPVKLQTAEAMHQVKQEVKTDTPEKVTLKPVKLQTAEAMSPAKQKVKQEVKTETPEKATSKSVKLQTVASVGQAKQEVKTETLEKATPKIVKLQTAESASQVKQEVKTNKQVGTQEQIKQVQTEKVKESLPISKDTLLFKAQTTKEVSTEQLVQVRSNSLTTQEVNRPKIKADETLKLLLRGEKVAKKESSGLTTDFSVATARVIAPTATKDASKSLESLLHGDQSDNTQSLKIDGFNVPKADSLDIKLHEAKQMTKYISQDVKTAIEDYKSPFTRIKVQLNPERLGAVELTVVQRGKNLHINLSSNNAAINALAMNSNDLKIQLTNNGINNASLNFNNNSQGSEGSFSGQGQNTGQQKEASREYNFFESEESNEEILNSLEIVVPDYA